MKSQWTEVESSAVRAVSYHPERNDLDVCYENGREYRYREVPRSKFHALLRARSIGAFVNIEIKPHHTYDEITPPSRQLSTKKPNQLRNAS